MRNVAVVLAGGTGSRMGSPVPKQFMQLRGRAVIEFSIDVFDGHEAIDEVAVVVHPDWRGELEAIVARNNWKKLTRVIDGGAERYMSSLNAIMAYEDEPDDTNLLLHDAARPWLSGDVVTRVCEALVCDEAVGVAVRSTDTVWEVDEGLVVRGVPERGLMWRAQTPQAFRLPLIRDAYGRALQDPEFRATDDCGVVHAYMPGTRVRVVEGEEGNRKVTFLNDLKVSE